MKSGIILPRQNFQLFGKDMADDPYLVYRELRETDPVHWDDSLKAWVVTRYQDVVAVLSDQRFASNRMPIARQRFPEEHWHPLWDVLGNIMLQRDGDEHQRLRNLVNKAFLRTAIEKWEPMVQEQVDSLLDAAAENGRMDFIWDFAVPLPLLVISEIVGVPKVDREQVKAWCDDVSVVALNFYAKISTEQLEKGLQSVQAFSAYVKDKIAALKQSPHMDLMSSLVKVQEAGLSLSFDELVATVLILLNAGNETTICLLGNGLVALLKNPEQLQLLRDDPSRIPNAIEEFLRYESPVQFQGRIASKEVMLGEKTIRKGDLVLAVLAAANRDPEQFPDPDCLDVTREHIHHVSFGYGHHFCVGAQLARMEVRVAFRRLLERFSVLELENDELTHRENFNLRCYERVPIRVG